MKSRSELDLNSGTAAIIAIEDDVEHRYVGLYWDGYPFLAGRLLYKHYDTREKVNELLSLGDISDLRDTVQNSKFVISDMLYRGDTHEEKTAPQLRDSFFVFCDNMIVEFVYHMSLTGMWSVLCRMPRNWRNRGPDEDWMSLHKKFRWYTLEEVLEAKYYGWITKKI